MIENRITVFISYSWDSPEHQEWVLKLAKDLSEKYGIIVIVDQYELKTGSDLPYFMEQSIEKADKVLIILTPNYKVRAEERTRGVGYESTMITQELFESPITNIKFLPILRRGTLETSSPKFLRSKISHNMVDDKKYYDELLKLAKDIYNHPVVDKPKLGAIPNFNELSLDPIIDKANSVLSEERLNLELNRIVDSEEGVEIFRKEIEFLNNQLQDKVNLYKQTTGLNFTFETNERNISIVQCNGNSVRLEWSSRFSNSAENNSLTIVQMKGYERIDRWGVFQHEEPTILFSTRYKFDLDYNKEVVWFSIAKFTTDKIIQRIFTYLIDVIQTEKSKNFRKH
ncbi:toll/interleukin-1 receptor domain-containing protein [Flavobacterium sp. 3-210]